MTMSYCNVEYEGMLSENALKHTVRGEILA